jgi:hypothetical protein
MSDYIEVECTETGCTQDLHHSMHFDHYDYYYDQDTDFLNAMCDAITRYFWVALGVGSAIVVALLTFGY